MPTNINIAGRLHSVATGNVVSGADEVMDDNFNEKQDVINAKLTVKTSNILLPSLTLAEQVTEENTLYIIKDTFDLDGDETTIPAGCVLQFQGGKIENGALILQDTFMDGAVQLGTDLSVSGSILTPDVFQSWFDGNDINAFTKFCSDTNGYSSIHFSPGEFNLTYPLTLNDRDKLSIYGNSCHIVTSEAMPISINGDTSELDTSITFQPVGMGSRNITVSNTASFHIGDVIAIIDATDYSFSQWRQAYNQGEFCTIQGISGNVLTLAQPIMGYYVHSAALYVIKRKFCKIGVRDLDITNNYNGYSYGIYAKNIIGGSFENINVGYAQICLSIANSLLCAVRNCNLIGHRNNGDSYGLSIGNSQNILAENCRCTGRNHGISTGGAGISINVPIVCRFITIRDCNLNTFDSTNASIWFHGNIEYGVVENCVAALIALGGNHCRAVNNTLISDDNNAFGGLMAYTELSGYDHILANNTVINGHIVAFGPLLEPLYAANAVYTSNVNVCDETIEIYNNSVVLNAETDYILYGGAPGDTRTNHEGVQLQAYTPVAYKRFVRFFNNKITAKYHNPQSNYAFFPNAAAHNVEVLFENNDISIPFFRFDDSTQTFRFANNIFRDVGWGVLAQIRDGIGNLIFDHNVFHYESLQRFRVVGLHSDASANVPIAKIEFTNNKLFYKHISSDNFNVLLSKGVIGMVLYKDNNIFTNGSTVGSSYAGISVTSGATISNLIIGENFCFAETRISDLRHNIEGIINTFSYSDRIWLETMWSNATITTFVPDNKAYSNGFSVSILTNKNGRTIQGDYTIAATVGNQANRPTLTTNDRGYCYFETSTSKPIYWTGSAWVDATGATV